MLAYLHLISQIIVQAVCNFKLAFPLFEDYPIHSSDKAVTCAYDAADTGCNIALREARIGVIDCMEF
jgi:hypothetical protein